MENLFSIPMILIYSALFGATMKIADLFDEHGMKRWFNGCDIVFGILWGFFGILLVWDQADVANIILAMVLAFLVRMRLDSVNHAIAAAMIIVAFLYKGIFDLTLFSTFFLIFIVFGSWRDYLGNIRKKNDWLYKINEPGWYYFVPTFIYGIISGNWIAFFVFTFYTIFYDLVKYFFFQLKLYKSI
jgi:hypothetical protein